MWSTVEKYAILSPKRLPGLPETPGFLKTAFVASGYHRLWAIPLVYGWGTNAALALQIPSSLSNSCGLRLRSIGDDPHMIPGGTFWIPAALRRLPRIASALLYTQTPDQPPKRPHIILLLILIVEGVGHTCKTHRITDCREKLWPGCVDSRLQSEWSLVSKWLYIDK